MLAMSTEAPPPSSLSLSLSRLRERVGVRATPRQLRTTSTDAERLLWHHLRDRRLAGFKFRRQHPVDSFVADFACLDAGLVVELDGGQHFERAAMAADQRRSGVLQAAGFTVLRFDNRQLLQETEAVLAVIRDWLLTRHPHPNPLPQAGEGVEHPSALAQAGEGAEDPSAALPLAGEGAEDPSAALPLAGEGAKHPSAAPEAATYSRNSI